MHKYLEQQKLMKLNKNSIQESLLAKLENNEKELTKKSEASSTSQKQVIFSIDNTFKHLLEN